ncbi:MAG: alpha/beta hydrolase [Spongiibacteraceae bacterium]|jgi:alpha-beta hydrolase superfamily lysophospholipase
MAKRVIDNIKHWILLRGLAREQQHWGDFVERSQRVFPDRQFYCLDLPGCGEWFKISSPLTIQAIRQHLQQQIISNNISEPFGVIGLSLGGMVALDWLEKDEQCLAAVIINTSSNDFPLHWRLQPKILWRGLAALLSPSAKTRETNILAMSSRQHRYNSIVINQWVDIQRQRPVSASTMLRQLIAASRFSAPKSIPNKYGLVLYSDKDQMVSYRCSKKLAKRFKWPRQCHRHAGHDIPLDDPKWILKQIKRWHE